MITYPGVKVRAWGYKGYKGHANKYAIAIEPSDTFDPTTIQVENIHVIICLDTSYSMNNFVTDTYKSRLDICRLATIDSLNFLNKVCKSSKPNIYISLVTFSQEAKTIIEYERLSKSSYDKIIKLVENIEVESNTNMGVGLKECRRIQKDHKCDKEIKILLSDGYINEGLSSSEIQLEFSSYFNTTIGIDSVTRYDQKLLSILTEEERERNCMTVDDLNEQITDSVFNNVTVLGNDFKIEGQIRSSNIENNPDMASLDKFTFNNKVFITIGPSQDSATPHIITIKMSDISGEYIRNKIKKNKSGLMNSNNNIIVSDDNGYAEYVYNLEKDTYDMALDILLYKIALKNKTVYDRWYNVIQEYIELANIFKSIDTEKQNKQFYEKVYNRCLALEKMYNKLDNDTLIKYIENVDQKYQQSLKPLIEADVEKAHMPDLLTPVSMCSIQSQRSSFAFVGRLASVTYSNS